MPTSAAGKLSAEAVKVLAALQRIEIQNKPVTIVGRLTTELKYHPGMIED